MPDYNLGRAHGTIRVDYDGRGVEQAEQDLNKLGDTSERTSQRTSASADRSRQDYDQLAAAAKRLEQEVGRAAAAEVAARARAEAAQAHFAQTQKSGTSSAQDLINAQRQVTVETKRYEDAVIRARNSSHALSIVQRDLANHRPDLSPKGDTSKFADIVRHLQNIDKQTKTSSSLLNTFRSRIALMIGSIAVASPTVAGLAVSLVALTGAIGPAIGALASLAAVGGTIATGFSGIGKVFKVAGQQAAGAGSSAAQSAQQQRAAAEQIVQAIRGVRDAQENLQSTQQQVARDAVQAAQQIVQAERQLRDAQFDALRAQENLTRARRDATRQLEDLRSQLAGGALDEKQAILDVQRAQLDLNKTLADPRSSDLDKQQAILNLEKQKKALEDVRRQNTRTAEDQARADAAGVDGSDQVVSAQQDVLHTQEAVGDSAVGVADAVVAGALQQIDAQRQIRDATEAVRDAQVALADAYLQAADAGSGGAAKMADAMANISPEAQKLVKAILGQSDAWKQVKFAVQDALFSGLSKEVAPLANQWLPLLKTGMVGIAHELNGLIRLFVEFLSRGQTTSEVANIFHNTADAVHNLAPGIVAVVQSLLNLADVGSSFLPKMATGFSLWAENLALVTDKSREAGTMQQWMQQGLDTLGKLWDLLKNVASIIGTIFTAFDQEGGDTLSTLVALTQRLEDFLKSAQGQDILHALGKTLAALAHLIGDVLIAAFVAFGPTFVTLAPLIQQFADILGKEILVTANLLAPVLKTIADVLSFLGPVLVPLIASMVLLNKTVALAKVVWELLNGTLKANPFIAIAAAVIAITFLIIENWTAIKQFLSDAWEWIKINASQAWEAIKATIIQPVIDTINWMTQTWNDFVGWIVGLWNSIGDRARDIWNHIKSAIADPIRDAVVSVLDFFRNLPGQILDFLNDLPSKMFNLGIDIIQGLLNGLKNIAGRIIDFFKNLAHNAIQTVYDILGIGSPSKVFADIGRFTLQGIIVGVDDLEPTVMSRMVEMATAMTVAATPTNVVPQGALPSSSIVSDTSARASDANARTINVQTLTLNVAGNLDPTDPVNWRKAVKRIKKDIETVDRSEQR